MSSPTYNWGKDEPNTVLGGNRDNSLQCPKYRHSNKICLVVLNLGDHDNTMTYVSA